MRHERLYFHGALLPLTPWEPPQMGADVRRAHMSKASRRRIALANRARETVRTEALAVIRRDYATTYAYEQLANGADPVALLAILRARE